MTREPFRGKVVWITGASSGIGRALALAFGRAGARLILSARGAQALEGVARESGAEAQILPLDLNELAELPAAARRALGLYGRVDIMVHNAGVAVRERAIATSLEVHERVLRTNYLGPVVLTRTILPSMIARGGGRFVVISSLSGKYGGPLLAAYAASKHALHGYFDTLRGEEREHGIGVTIAIPGFVRTEITAHALTGSGGRFGRVLPIYREAMTPEECAARILRAVAREKEEVLVGGLEVWTVYLRRWWPRLAALVIWGHPVKLRNRVLAALPVLGRRYWTGGG
ncbi:MAG TPA: SDR family NAD(P)-dependent oxidoreductase [Gemmatimonadales bacterium]|nr:SDR family NAD(P)-dependent oxidoreductase [Gemmatimonadales bacterium]